MTIGSLQDIGYTVNYAAADAYSLPGGRRRGGDHGRHRQQQPDRHGRRRHDHRPRRQRYAHRRRRQRSRSTAAPATTSSTAGQGTIPRLSPAVSSTTRSPISASAITISGPDGSDTLVGVEHLRFADGTIHLNDGSTLFDTVFYDRTYLDVFHAGADALSHYNSFGRREGRDPNAFFSTSWYLSLNPDVRASGANPLDHYHRSAGATDAIPRPISIPGSI